MERNEAIMGLAHMHRPADGGFPGHAASALQRPLSYLVRAASSRRPPRRTPSPVDGRRGSMAKCGEGQSHERARCCLCTCSLWQPTRPLFLPLARQRAVLGRREPRALCGRAHAARFFLTARARSCRGRRQSSDLGSDIGIVPWKSSSVCFLCACSLRPCVVFALLLSHTFRHEAGAYARSNGEHGFLGTSVKARGWKKIMGICFF